MFYGFQALGIVFVLIIYLAVFALIAWVLYFVIRQAVRDAMDDHFRKTQWYQQTGLWYSGRPPKGLPGAEQLTKQQRKDLPPDERPQ